MTALELVRQLERHEAALGIDTYVPGPEWDPLENPKVAELLRRPGGNPQPRKGVLKLPRLKQTYLPSHKERVG